MAYDEAREAEREPPNLEGVLHKELYYWVRCDCGREEIPPGKSARVATKHLREWGWRLTKYDGWLCPDCAKR
jgi:hypothetical protein